jgi:hypothetical protein
MKQTIRSLFFVAALLAIASVFSCAAHAQTTTTNASGGTTTISNPVDQAGTVFGLLGLGSASTNSTLQAAGKGLSDAFAFVEGNTNGWARISLEGGYLRTQHQGSGGFFNLLIPLSGTNNVLGTGFGIAYINGNWYDATLSARLGSNIPLKLGNTIDLSQIFPLYVYAESGGGYNFGTRTGIAQAFGGASLHYILMRTSAGNTWDLTVGYAVGTISDVTGNVTAIGGSLTFSF